MTWWCNEPGQLQPWYWQSLPESIQALGNNELMLTASLTWHQQALGLYYQSHNKTYDAFVSIDLKPITSFQRTDQQSGNQGIDTNTFPWALIDMALNDKQSVFQQDKNRIYVTKFQRSLTFLLEVQVFCLANERWHYNIGSLICWAHTQNDPSMQRKCWKCWNVFHDCKFQCIMLEVDMKIILKNFCFLPIKHDRFHNMFTIYSGIILCMRPANDRPHCNVTSSLIGWAHTQGLLKPCRKCLVDIYIYIYIYIIYIYPKHYITSWNFAFDGQKCTWITNVTKYKCIFKALPHNSLLKVLSNGQLQSH